MILGTGIDLAEPARLRRACARRGERLLARLFTEGEQRLCARARDPWPRYAARFAAKEAFAKALGTGMREGIRWREIETVSDRRGKPHLALTGRARELAARLGVTRIHLSLSDLDGVVAAMVVLEGEREGGLP